MKLFVPASDSGLCSKKPLNTKLAFCAAFESYGKILYMARINETRKRIFFQDFLFQGIQYDEQEYPVANIKYAHSFEDIADYTVLLLSVLIKMNREIEWENLFARIEEENICIRDDIEVENEKIKSYKQMFLSVYYLNLQKHCKNICVAKTQELS